MRAKESGGRDLSQAKNVWIVGLNVLSGKMFSRTIHWIIINLAQCPAAAKLD
jgi:hypothetical protein